MVCDCAEFKEKTQDLQLHHVVFFNLQRKINDLKLRKNIHIYCIQGQIIRQILHLLQK
jgi:hypothetical protein